jgi:hypothetical protein
MISWRVCLLIGQKDIFLFIRRSQTDYVCIG